MKAFVLFIFVLIGVTLCAVNIPVQLFLWYELDPVQLEVPEEKAKLVELAIYNNIDPLVNAMFATGN